MKANEAPEKIYFSGQQQWSNPFIGLMQKCADTDIEYTHTESFIEKACEILERMVQEVTYEDLEGNSVQHYDKTEFIEDFRNYMKRE